MNNILQVNFFNSLGTKLLKLGFSIYFVITVIITTIQMFAEYNHVKDSMLKELVYLKETFSNQFSDGLWAYDKAGLNIVLSGLSKVESIAGVVIEDTLSEKFVTTGILVNKEDKRVIFKTTDIVLPEKTHFYTIVGHGLLGKIFELRSELWVTPDNQTEKRKHVGFASFITTEKKIFNKVKHGFIMIIINSILKTISLWFIFIILAKHMITNPLQSFSNAIIQIDPKKPKQNTVVNDMSKRTDEIGVLSSVFIRMIDSISENLFIIYDLNNNLELKVSERTNQLLMKTREIKGLLNTLKQGVFTFGKDKLITNEYSTYLEAIFDTKIIAGVNYADFLFKNSSLDEGNLDQAIVAINSIIGFDDFAFDLNSHLLPKEFTRKNSTDDIQYLELNWEYILGGNKEIEKILVSIRDVTALKAAETQAKQHKIEIEILDQILNVGVSKMTSFIKNAYSYLQKNAQLLQNPREDKEYLNELFRNMHTLKGNSRTYGLSHAVLVIHQAEQFYQDVRSGKKSLDKTRMLQELSDVQEKIKIYEDFIIQKFQKSEESSIPLEMDDLLSLDLSTEAEMAQAYKQLKFLKNTLENSTFQEILADEIKSMEGLAQSVNKETPNIEFGNSMLRIKKSKYEFLKDIMTHLFRNSLDHGIEKSTEREKKGKRPEGKIFIQPIISENTIKIEYFDDGAGLNIGALKKKCFKSNPSDLDIANMIFESGLSTAEQVTDLSGRGVGMDAVRSFLEQRGGKIDIEFTNERDQNEFRSFKFVISLPL